MFVHLDLGWMQHPFPVSSFRITHPQQVEKIRSLGLAHVRWCPQRSELPDAAADVTPGTEAAVPLAPAAPAAPAVTAPEGEAAPAAAAAASVTAAAPAARAAASAQRRNAPAAGAARIDACQRDFEQAGRACEEAFAEVHARPGDARARAEALAQSLLERICIDDELCVRALGQQVGAGASAHAVNVSVLALLMGRTLGLGEDEMRDLGVGALLHDVGKIELPAAQRHADTCVGAQELAGYRSHVARGVAQGKRMGLSAGALLVLAQHHEHADATGFPARVAQARLSLLAGVVALVNRYDNLCNPCDPARGLTPHEALSLLFARSRSHFDAGLLNAFIGMMGVYPAGSLVQLTDDRYALVTSVNSARRLKPSVLVHDAAHGGGRAQALNLLHTPDLGIRRSLRAALLPPDALASLAPPARVSYFFEPARAAETGDDQALAA